MSEQNETIIRPKFHHVNLKTTQLQEMIDWYGEVVGIEVTQQSAGGAFVTNDEANHRIALASPPGLKDDPEKLTHTGIHHTAFEYDSVDDLLATYERLKAKGIEPHMAMDHGMTTSIYYIDPDGNSVELQSDNFGDWQKSKEFMRTSPEFDEEPIGRFFDPQKMVEARRAGASKEEIHKRAYAGEWRVDYDMRIPL